MFLSYAYFYSGGGWNQNSRFDLTRAIVERQTLQIDAYRSNTSDLAEFNGHFYTDKAPGASLTAVPAVAVVRWLLEKRGADLAAPETVADLLYAATVTAATLPAVFAALCVYWIGLKQGFGKTASGLGSVVCALGTPFWAYGSILYGHALAAGCLMGAFFGASTLGAPSTPVRRATLAFAVGLAAGWAVVAEFPAAAASAVIVVFACWQVRGLARPGPGAILGFISLGAGCAAAVLFAYHWAAFGSAFHLGYLSEVEGFEGMTQGFFGITWPRPRVALSLLFNQHRGLISLAPILVVTPVGLWLLARVQPTRAAAVVAAAVASGYFVITAGYVYWSGGSSYGPRHLGPALPFLCLGVAPVWRHASRWARVGILALATLSAGQTLLAVATDPQPGDFTRPRQELFWPAFASGDFPAGWVSVLGMHEVPASQRQHVPRPSWNLGQRFGLRGHASLAPLAAIWLVGAVVWWREGNRRHVGPAS